MPRFMHLILILILNAMKDMLRAAAGMTDNMARRRTLLALCDDDVTDGVSGRGVKAHRDPHDHCSACLSPLGGWNAGYYFHQSYLP